MSAPDPWIVEVDAVGFQREVLEASLERPVLIDFWASWCEPCRLLGPLLEERAREGSGRFRLAKIDVDRNPELAQALRVQGIPAVLAVVQGKIVDGFEGALPPEALDAFLDRVAPSQAGTGPADPVAEAKELVADGAIARAIALLTRHRDAHPDDQAATCLLVDLLLDAGKEEAAEQLFATLSADALETPEGKALAERFDFARSGVDLGQLRAAVEAAPEDAAAHLALGRALLAAKDFPAGLESLLEAVRLEPEGTGVGGEAKDAMLGAFEVLGLEDPVANDYRFKLSLELFA